MKMQDAINTSADKLYEDIGRSISVGIDLGEVDPEELRERGIRWFAKRKKELQEKVCNGYIAEVVLQEGRSWDQTLLLAAVADLIASLVVGVSPITVAALILKEGLHQFCSNNQS
jgi:hypothetical protein